MFLINLKKKQNFWFLGKFLNKFLEPSFDQKILRRLKIENFNLKT